MEGSRVVLDTNVVISAALFPSSLPARALQRAQSGIVLISNATAYELQETLLRPRFDRYLSRTLREELIRSFTNACVLVAPSAPIQACRDPRDNKFLEVAIYGEAQFLVTGDEDLLALHPFQSVAILAPSAFLDRLR